MLEEGASMGMPAIGSTRSCVSPRKPITWTTQRAASGGTGSETTS